MRPVPLQDWDPTLQTVIEDMNGRPIDVHSLMANHPALLNAWWNLRMYLVNGGDLDQRQAELVILRIAVHMRSWYEWGSHVVRGLDCGLTLEEIERVRTGSEDWEEPERALLAAVDDVVACNAITEDTRAALAPYFTDRQMLDIIALHGMYVTLSCMINTWGLKLDAAVHERLPAGVTEDAFLA